MKVLKQISISLIGMFLMLTFTFGSKAEAANFYVRAGASGSNNGTDWNNAWNGFNAISWATVNCGDTIWVAGGNYSQDLSPNKKCSNTARLLIQRARSDASAAVSAAGYSSAYDSAVHQINGAGISFIGDNDYITISGRTTASGGNHGWWIDLRGRTGGTGIEFANGAGADFNVMEYMDIQGPGEINYTLDGRGIDATPFSTANGNVFSHMKIFDWESAIITAGMNGTTFEYLDVFDIGALNWQSFHPNGIYAVDANNVIVRYSKFHKGPKGLGVGEGIFFEQSGGNSNWQIYGNLFYNLNSTGLKAIEITSAVPGLKIFNNTFDNIIVPGVYVAGGSCGLGSEMRNNLFFATSTGSCGTMSNNLVASSNPFINRLANDYRIVSTIGSGYPRNAAINLSSLFSTDIDGNSFGSDGVWDIGAYEFGGTAPTTLQAPANLRLVSVSYN